MPLPQMAGPQTFGVPPPPQVCGRVHVPQSRVPPQPSAIIPQFVPWAAHVVLGVQHVPFNDFLLDLAHTPLQQLSLVRHVWPSGIHGPALATRHPTTMRAAMSIGTKNGTRRGSALFMTASCVWGALHDDPLPPLTEATVARDAQSWARLRAHEHRRRKLHDQAVLTRRAGYRRVNATRRARAVGGVDAEAGPGAEVRREAEAAAAAPTGGANRRAGDVGVGGRGGGGRGRRCGGRRAGIRRAAAGPLGDTALSGALRGGFYRAGVESPHWRRRHAALVCVAGAERLLGGLAAHPAAAARIGPTRLAIRYARTRACGTPPDDDEGGGEHRHEERHPAGPRSLHESPLCWAASQKGAARADVPTERSSSQLLSISLARASTGNLARVKIKAFLVSKLTTYSKNSVRIMHAMLRVVPNAVLRRRGTAVRDSRRGCSPAPSGRWQKNTSPSPSTARCSRRASTMTAGSSMTSTPTFSSRASRYRARERSWPRFCGSASGCLGRWLLCQRRCREPRADHPGGEGVACERGDGRRLARLVLQA